jgi:tRNA-dependent cyclodipeptide synthase
MARLAGRRKTFVFQQPARQKTTIWRNSCGSRSERWIPRRCFQKSKSIFCRFCSKFTFVLVAQPTRFENPMNFPNYTTQPGTGAIDFGTHRYKAQLNKVSPAQTDLSQLKRCMLGISLGTHNIEGARLEAVLEWISANFEHCAVVVGDSVYRLTLQLLHGMPEADAQAQALADGRTFEQSYAPLFRQYAHGCTFEWLPLSRVAESASFAGHLQTLETLYAQNPSFQASVKNFAQAYLGRGDKCGDIDTGLSAEALRSSKQYLLEESALFACLREQDWPILVYPGSIDSIVDLVEGRFEGAPEPLTQLAFAALEVKRKGLFFADGSNKVIRAGASASLDRNVGGDSEFLSELDDSSWAKLLKASKLKKFQPREVILKAGDSERHLLILTDGRAEVSLQRPDGSIQQLAVLEAGTVFGEQSFLDGFPRSATVTAMNECTLRSLSRKDFQNLLTQEPIIACAVLEDLGRVLSIRTRQLLFELRHMP